MSSKRLLSEVTTFNARDMVMNSKGPRLSYNKKLKINTDFAGWGQLKLVIGEMMYLIMKLPENEEVDILYVGAAPGTHLNILISLFEEIEVINWHLYDIRDFDIEEDESKGIYIYNQLFTDEDAEAWSNRDNVMFICDMRTATHTKTKDKFILEEEILDEMNTQMRWVKTISPMSSCLKMRLPYYYPEINNRYTEYLSGVIYYRPFLKKSSTEGMLISEPNEEGDYETYRYDNRLNEDLWSYHNNVTRTLSKYDNYPSIARDNDIGLINNYDCVYFLYVCIKYIMTFTEAPEEDMYDNALSLCKEIMEGCSTDGKKTLNTKRLK